MTAAMQGRTETVKMLLAHGADLTAKDRFGATALSSASAPNIRVLLAQRSARAAGQTTEQKNNALGLRFFYVLLNITKHLRYLIWGW